MTATRATENAERTVANRSRRRDERDDLRLLFRQLPGAAWLTDRDLRIVEFIGDVEQNLGIPHASIRGMSVTAIAASQDPADPAIAAHFAALRARSSSFRYRLRGHWYEVMVEPLRDAGGAIVGCIGAAVEISRRVELEQRASASEARLADLHRRSISLLEATIESTADGILVVDRAEKVVAYNRRFLSLWNIPRELAARGDDRELLSYVLEQLADPEAFLRRVRELYAMPGDEDLDVLELRNGRVFERYSRPQHVAGEIVGRVWSFRDITARERQLRDALLLADASRLLATLDSVAALEGVAHLLASTQWDACAIDLFDEEGARTRIASAQDREASDLPAIPPSALRFHSDARSLADRWLVQAPVLSGHQVVGMIAVIGPAGMAQDASERELLEEIARRCAVALENARLYRLAQENIRAREEFLAVASHEIRGPVATLRLAVDALRNGVGDREKVIGIIDREERRLEHLVGELLDAGSARSGRMPLQSESVDLAAIVRDVAARYARDLERSHSTLIIRGDSIVCGNWDRARLDQVVANLVGNAIKFGAGKPIEVRVSVVRERAILEVTDHGIGISADKLRSVFEPFERAVPARHYGGLGLGLYIVRSIVTQLGGSIDVRSTVGVGTTFVVELPCKEAR